MNILVINAGSSSLKYQLLNPDSGVLLAKGLCERIGIDGKFTYKPQAEGKEVLKAVDVAMPTHSEAIQAVLNALVDPKNGVVGSMKEIDAVGHRAKAHIRQVARGGQNLRGRQGLQRFQLALLQAQPPQQQPGQPGALLGETAGGLLAQPAAGAGDDGNFVFQSFYSKSSCLMRTAVFAGTTKNRPFIKVPVKRIPEHRGEVLQNIDSFCKILMCETDNQRIWNRREG